MHMLHMVTSTKKNLSHAQHALAHAAAHYIQPQHIPILYYVISVVVGVVP